MSRTDAINLGFIGAGRWATTRHFPALDTIRARRASPNSDHPPIRLRGLCSLNMDEAIRVGGTYAFERIYRDVDELAADPVINAFAIAVTPSALLGIVEKLLPRRLPILSEKPPSATADDARQLAERVNVPNLVAFNRRYNVLNNEFKRLLEGTPNIYFVEGHFCRYLEREDRFITETGIHLINLMEYLFGPIVRVRTDGFANPFTPTRVRLAHIEFASGIRGRLSFLPSTGSQFERIDAHSPGLSLYLHGSWRHAPGRILVHRIEGDRSVETILTSATADQELIEDGYIAEYEDFFEAVRTGAPTRSNFQNAVTSMAIAEAIQQGLDYG